MPTSSIKLSELIKPDYVMDLEVESKEAALKALSDRLSQDPVIQDPEAFYRAILHREEQVSTGCGMGIAIPHVKIPEVSDYVVGVGRVEKGIDFQALDGKPVYLIFMIGASARQTREFVKILAQVTHLLKDPETRQGMMGARIPDQFIDVIRAHER